MNRCNKVLGNITISYMSNLRFYRYAVALEEYGSFKRAAIELHVSQPALSKGISQLEQEFGVQLFARNQRPVLPTAEGRRFLEEARRSLQADTDLRSDLRSMHGFVRGTLRVGAGPAMAAEFMGRVAARMVRDFPHIQLVIRTGNWRDLLRELREESIDLFVGDQTETDHADLSVESLPARTVSWVARMGHPLHKKRRVEFADLRNYPFVSVSIPSWAKRWLREQLSLREKELLLPIVECNDYGVLADIVANSDSLSVGPAGCFEENLAAERLQLVRVAGIEATTNVGIVRLNLREVSEAGEAFTEVLQEEMSREARV